MAAAQQQQQQQPPQPQGPPLSMSDRIAGGIASGLATGSAAAAAAVRRGADAVNDAVTRLKERHIAAAATAADGSAVPGGAAPGAPQQPQPQPQQHVRVHPALKASLKVAAAAAAAAAAVTGKLAAFVGDASYALALRIAKALPGHSDRPTAAACAANGTANGGGAELRPEERSAFKTVGAAGLVAYVQVYDALEDAARAVLEHSAGAAAQYIGYK